MSNFGPVELSIEKRTDYVSIADQTYTPNINIGNVASNNFNSPAQQLFEFDVTEQGDYVIAIYSAASEWSDCIIGQLMLTANSYVNTSINNIENLSLEPSATYDLQGRKLSQPQKGIFIQNGKKYFGK